jgi:leader peptidase (prepilin peptidase)/N-methyltransferase
MVETQAICLLVAGPLVGSFIGTVVKRSGSPRRILWGRSACPACGTVLDPTDLMPVISWLMSRGRCRHCARPISWFYLEVELAATGVALWSILCVAGWPLWPTAMFGWCLLAIALIDHAYFRLPDYLVLPLVPAGFLVAFADEPTTLPDHLVGAAVGFTSFALVRRLYRGLRKAEGLGFGDVKLLAAAGAWVSSEGLPSVVLIATVLGLASVSLRSLGSSPPSLTTQIPFGTFLCAATWLVWLHGPVTIL